MISKLLYHCPEAAFKIYQQHLNKYKQKDSLVCEAFMEDGEMYAGSTVTPALSTPDADPDLLVPGEDTYELEWTLPMKSEYTTVFAQHIVAWYECKTSMLPRDRAPKMRPDKQARRCLRDSVCFWLQVKDFLRSQVSAEHWSEVDSAWTDGDMEDDIKRLQKECSMYIQPSNFAVLSTLTQENASMDESDPGRSLDGRECCDVGSCGGQAEGAGA